MTIDVTKSNPIVYVVIVTWNGMKWIKRCLSCLRESTIPVKTIVIDNGSTDNTIEFIKTNFQEVDVYRMNRNLGFGQANNYGIKIALQNNCDFVYLLNQDAYVYPDMFDKLLEGYKQANKSINVGVISPLHLYRDGIHFDAHFKGYLYNIALGMAEDALLTSTKAYYEVGAVPAAGWLLPRKSLENIGGFDPIFFHYGEDHNYSQRVNFHGMKTIVVPTAKMIHDRDGFGNVNMAKKDLYFRTIKTEYMLNINMYALSITKNLIKKDIAYSLDSFKYLIKGEFRMFWELQKAVKLNLFFIPKYLKDRTQNRRKGNNWL